MAIFKNFQETISGLIPTILRKFDLNILKLALEESSGAADAVAQSLDEFAKTGWPLPTAETWVLDEHWGPVTGILRNGVDDDLYRRLIRAKRLLNRSWGAADQALVIFRLLLPEAATLDFTPYYPKNWTINIANVDMVETATAINFMRKLPSPQGGGFSVCGDNGLGVIQDKKALNYGSVYGTEGVDYEVTGWYSSVYYPDPPPDLAGTAGHAHVVPI